MSKLKWKSIDLCGAFVENINHNSININIIVTHLLMAICSKCAYVQCNALMLVLPHLPLLLWLWLVQRQLNPNSQHVTIAFDDVYGILDHVFDLSVYIFQFLFRQNKAHRLIWLHLSIGLSIQLIKIQLKWHVSCAVVILLFLLLLFCLFF